MLLTETLLISEIRRARLLKSWDTMETLHNPISVSSQGPLLQSQFVKGKTSAVSTGNELEEGELVSIDTSDLNSVAEELMNDTVKTVNEDKRTLIDNKASGSAGPSITMEEGEIVSTDDEAENKVKDMTDSHTARAENNSVIIISDDESFKEKGKHLSLEDHNTKCAKGNHTVIDLTNDTYEIIEVIESSEGDDVDRENRSGQLEGNGQTDMFITKDQTGQIDQSQCPMSDRIPGTLSSIHTVSKDKNAEAGTQAAKPLEPLLCKKRKRTLLDLGEFTPKRLLPSLPLSIETLSPIDCAEKCSASTEGQTETPIISTKFDFSVIKDNQNFNLKLCSTPLPSGKVRKSIFGNLESNRNETKVDLKGEEKVDKFGPDYFAQNGRFRDEVHVSQTQVEDEVEDMTDDILGLEKTLSSINEPNSDSDNDSTLHEEKSAEDLETTVIARDETKVIDKELQPETVSESNKCTANELVTVVEVTVETKENKNDQLQTTETLVTPEKPELTPVDNTRPALVEMDVNKNTNIHTEKLDTNRNAIKEVDRKGSKKSGEKENKTSAVNANDRYIISKQEIENLGLPETTGAKHEDLNNLMRLVRKRWESSGIPDQETNLTTALRFRQNTLAKGLECRKGYLEGEKLSCLDLTEEDVRNNNDQKMLDRQYDIIMNDLHKKHKSNEKQMYSR